MISSFLKQKIGIPLDSKTELALNKLSGKSFGEVHFFDSVEECIGNIEHSMPIYFFPIGKAKTDLIGLHLLPSDINNNRFAIMSYDLEFSRGSMIEIASNIEDFVYRCLAKMEADEIEYPKRKFDNNALLIASEIFGTDFYVKGKNATVFVEKLMLNLSRASANDYSFIYSDITFDKEPVEMRLEVLIKGLSHAPNCLSLYIDLIELYAEMNDFNKAANTFIASLKCFHHTIYLKSIDGYYQLGKSLIVCQKGIFSEEVVFNLNNWKDKDRMALISKLSKAGEFEKATKVICDMAHDFGDYNQPLPLLVKLFEKLNWNWALALCEIRQNII